MTVKEVPYKALFVYNDLLYQKRANSREGMEAVTLVGCVHHDGTVMMESIIELWDGNYHRKLAEDLEVQLLIHKATP